MNEGEFLDQSDAILARIQQALDDSEIAEANLIEGVLNIEFDDGSQVIVNRHAPNHEIWLAAKSGGFHFRSDGKAWLDTRDGVELFTRLSHIISMQAGIAFVL